MQHRIAACARVLGIAALALILSGCSTVSFSSVFHRDGTATHSVTIMFLRGGLVDSDARRLERQLDSIVERASADGYTAERLNTMTQTGVRVSITTREVLDTGAALNSLYNSLVRESSGPIAPFVGGFDRESTAVGGGQFSFDLEVDGAVLLRSVQDVSPGHRQLSNLDGVNEVVSFAYSVSMPGHVRDTNGVRSGSSIVRWDLPLDGTTTMSARSNLTVDSPWILIVLTIIGSLILVVAIAASVAWVLIYNRNRRSPAVGGLAAGTLPHATNGIATDATLTVQEVGSSLARVVDRVIGGQDVAATADEEQTEDVVDGAQPQGD